jgi:RNA polymerase sigma-70 factor (ECF subfamily)
MKKSLTQEQTPQSVTKDQEAERIAAAQRDPQAFGDLYDHYAPSIYRYLLSRLGNVEEARDVTSQTFLKAVEIFPRYTHRGYFSAWLFSIARSKYVDHVRRRKHGVEIIREEQVDPQPDPLTEVVATERMAELMKCIRTLAPEEQELLRLRYVADLSFAEMAELLLKSESAVKKSFYRLLARLQSQLEA